MLTRLFLIALLAAGLASAKTYDFNLPNAFQAGSTTLKAGPYKLTIDGSKVTLKDGQGNNVQASTKVETVEKPFPATVVSTTQSNGASRIEWIGLAGSKSKIVFE